MAKKQSSKQRRTSIQKRKTKKKDLPAAQPMIQPHAENKKENEYVQLILDATAAARSYGSSYMIQARATQALMQIQAPATQGLPMIQAPAETQAPMSINPQAVIKRVDRHRR
ncbi:hypothetical protein M3Y97_00416400 [Aphelenchoides bicaudatus]|nr:hypothetical protein M3Y97_00416400 [Aphelenchoides bicaudatus]